MNGLAASENSRGYNGRVAGNVYASATTTAFNRMRAAERALPAAHARVTALAERLLPARADLPENADDDAQ